MYRWILQILPAFLLCYSNCIMGANGADIHTEILDSLGYGQPQHVIIGGQNALSGQFPFIVSLRLYGGHSCGGSIISRNFVLTAAHCVSRRFGRRKTYQAYPLNEITLYVGSHLRLSGGTVYNVAQVILHPDYKEYDGDIALLRAATAIELHDDRVEIIPLRRNQLPQGTTVTIAGWGYTQQNSGNIPENLQFATLTSISTDVCKRRIHLKDESVICLSHNVNRGTCFGDSGGPAIYDNTLIGVANFVVGGCASQYPDGYANITHYESWILANSDLS